MKKGGDGKDRKIVNIRMSDVHTGEILGEMPVIHTRGPRSAFGDGFLMTAQKQLAHLVAMRREISGECIWVIC